MDGILEALNIHGDEASTVASVGMKDCWYEAGSHERLLAYVRSLI